MATLKLNTPAGAGPAKRRKPLRPGAPRVHPTQAQANAERDAAKRAAPVERPRPTGSDGGPHDGPPPPRRGDGAPTNPRRPHAGPHDPVAPDADRAEAAASHRPDRPWTPARSAAPPADRRPPAPGRDAPRSAAQRRLPAASDAPRPRPVDRAAPAGQPRLSKRMSELGLASRREADAWIEQGFVRVDGQVVDQLGARVGPAQRIEIDPQAQLLQAQRVTVLLHKPLGIVSGQAEDGHTPAVALVTAANRWARDPSKQRFHAGQLRSLAPAGRLDLDSTGLLVLTQDGRVAKLLIGAGSAVEKEYVVRVDWPEQPQVADLNTGFPAERLALLRHGLVLDGEPLLPAQVSWQSERQLRVVLRQGKKRQIRRMCELVGLQVVALRRIRIGRIHLGDLPAGQWRYLAPFESFA